MAAVWAPLPYQRELSADSSVVRGIIGGNRTGKTEWGAREASYYLTGTHPNHKITVPNQVWIGTPSFDTQIESAQPKLLKFLKKEDIARIEYYQGNKIKSIYLTNGSVATFKSYEQSNDKWMGAEKRLIWFDEEPPHSIWTEAVVRHGAGVPLNIIFTLTPINGMTWLYDEIWQQAEAKGIKILTPSWEDNFHLSKDQISTMTSMLTPEELEVRKFGRFVRRIGLVCSWWRRDIHIEDLSQFDPRGCTIYVGIDFGFTTSSTAALFVAIRGDDLYLFNGIYEKGLTTSMLAVRIKEKLGSLVVTKWVADSAAAEDIAELRSYGFAIEAVKKETGTSNINWDEHRARKLQEIGQINLATNRPRIHISQDLIAEVDGRRVHWFANEAENLRWKQVRTGDGLHAKPIWSNEQPKDAIDALSYILVSLPVQIPVKYVNQFERKRMVPKNNLFDDDGFYL